MGECHETKRIYGGVFALLFFNFLFFALDHWVQLPCHENVLPESRGSYVVAIHNVHVLPRQLGSLIVEYFLFIHIGKLIEEEEGAFGVWFSYIATGTGASLASWLMLPKSVGGVLGMGAAATVSLGASGAVFGLFARVSVLVKLSEWKKFWKSSCSVSL